MACSRTPRLLALLDNAPCDVAILVGARPLRPGPVLVPFSGSEHDWAAVELGAWLARGDGRLLQLAGASTGSEGRDASRLLANASLAVQRGLGIAAEPVIVEPSPPALVMVARAAGVVVVGFRIAGEQPGWVELAQRSRSSPTSRRS